MFGFGADTKSPCGFARQYQFILAVFSVFIGVLYDIDETTVIIRML